MAEELIIHGEPFTEHKSTFQVRLGWHKPKQLKQRLMLMSMSLPVRVMALAAFANAEACYVTANDSSQGDFGQLRVPVQEYVSMCCRHILPLPHQLRMLRSA